MCTPSWRSSAPEFGESRLTVRARPESFGRGSRVTENCVSPADPLALSESMAGTPFASAAPPCAPKVSAAGDSSAARSTSIRLQSLGATRETSTAKLCSRSARKWPVAAVESGPIAPSISKEAPSRPATLRRLSATFGPVFVTFSANEPLSICASPTRAICSEPALSDSERSRSPIRFPAARLGNPSTSSESLARSTSSRPGRPPPPGPLKASAPVSVERSSASLRLRPENPAGDASTAPDSDALR